MSGFLEELGSDPPAGDGAGSSSGADPQGTPQEPAGTAAPTGEGTGQAPSEPQASSSDDELTQLRADVAYLRGVVEATRQQGGNGQQPTAPPEMTPEQAKEWEEKYLTDPWGETNRIAEEKVKGIVGDVVMALSRENMRREASDYDEMIAEFDKMAQKDNTLWSRLQSEGGIDPARWAYNVAKNAKTPKETPEEMEERIRQKILKEQAAQAAGETPPSPATAPGTGGTAPARSTENVPDPLEGNAFD